MPKFKNSETGDIFEVSEEHADTVIRVQGVYEEVDDCPCDDEDEVAPKRKKSK